MILTAKITTRKITHLALVSLSRESPRCSKIGRQSSFQSMPTSQKYRTISSNKSRKLDNCSPKLPLLGICRADILILQNKFTTKGTRSASKGRKPFNFTTDSSNSTAVPNLVQLLLKLTTTRSCWRSTSKRSPNKKIKYLSSSAPQNNLNLPLKRN